MKFSSEKNKNSSSRCAIGRLVKSLEETGNLDGVMRHGEKTKTNESIEPAILRAVETNSEMNSHGIANNQSCIIAIALTETISSRT